MYLNTALLYIYYPLWNQVSPVHAAFNANTLITLIPLAQRELQMWSQWPVSCNHIPWASGRERSSEAITMAYYLPLYWSCNPFYGVKRQEWTKIDILQNILQNILNELVSFNKVHSNNDSKILIVMHSPILSICRHWCHCQWCDDMRVVWNCKQKVLWILQVERHVSKFWQQHVVQ